MCIIRINVIISVLSNQFLRHGIVVPKCSLRHGHPAYGCPNLSIPSDRVNALSSSHRLLPPALVLLLVSAAIVVIKVFIDKGKAETKKQETRLVTKSTKRAP